MEDKNREQSIPFGPYDMSQYVEFAYSINVWRSWKYVSENVKKAIPIKTNTSNNLYAGRFTQWKKDLHKHYERYDSPKVALVVGCPIELVDRRHEWEWLCGHFQDEKYLGGSKFPKIDMFKEVYVWPGDEMTKQLHVTCLRDPSALSSRQRTEEVELLTSEVAGLKEQIAAQQSQLAVQSSLMNQICLVLQIFGIRFLNIEPPLAILVFSILKYFFL
ncbi:hypothetical protein D8674_011117 [Pyrus ussuriensis x Pyrus communis]|uniref:Uncharacterized protein n=1 Tax=Pyrus ussuriensis x Pyrus communis TaxID=2448454 RepID=A0A5N5FXU0_9ROSA|nr:hypothetical protein D8674_011117 [Pyrus ussuriensis x Pyrus communis]